MTTEAPTSGTGGADPQRARTLLGPLSVSGAVGLLLVATAALTTGTAAATGATIGAVLVCLVFAFGAVVLGTVALVAPGASLLVALLTYTLQVVVVGLVYYGLSSGGSLEGPIDPRWLSGAVIACTLGWTLTQVVVTSRARQLVYDLPSPEAEASVR